MPCSYNHHNIEHILCRDWPQSPSPLRPKQGSGLSQPWSGPLGIAIAVKYNRCRLLPVRNPNHSKSHNDNRSSSPPLSTPKTHLESRTCTRPCSSPLALRSSDSFGSPLYQSQPSSQSQHPFTTGSCFSGRRHFDCPIYEISSRSSRWCLDAKVLLGAKERASRHPIAGKSSGGSKTNQGCGCRSGASQFRLPKLPLRKPAGNRTE